MIQLPNFRKRFAVTLFVLLLIVAAPNLGLPLGETEIEQLVKVAIAYIGGQSFSDAFAPYIKQYLSRPDRPNTQLFDIKLKGQNADK